MLLQRSPAVIPAQAGILVRLQQYPNKQTPPESQTRFPPAREWWCLLLFRLLGFKSDMVKPTAPAPDARFLCNRG